MADLPSILGGMAQGFLDFGKSAVDLFGTGGAAVGDLVDTIRTGKVSTKNQDDFRKWLYNTNDVQDAAAKGLGTALNGVQTVTDYIPGIGAVTRNPLFNAGQGALGGLADEFKTYGKDYDLGRAGERAAVSAGAALASGSLGDALKKSASPLLSSGTVQGLARGATGGAITGGGYAAIDGGDVMQSALQGAGTGALIGGATGLAQDFKPAKTYDVELTDSEKQARVANIDDQLARLDTSTPEGSARYNELIKARAVYDAPADKIQTLYHQTSADSFADFSPEKRSAGVMDQGTPSGIFLKETDADIGLPGKNQLMFDVKMENPYEVDSREALANYARSRSKTYADLYDQAVALDEKAANVYDDFTNELQDKYKQYYYEPDETKKAALKKDVDYLLKNIKKLSDEKAAEYKSQGADVARKAQEELSRILTQDGYDSVILANDKGSFGRNIKSYIALSPYDQMAEVNAPKALEATLADADMAVNSVMESRVAPGQLGLFDDMPTQTPKTGTRQTSLFDQSQEGVDYYGGDVEMIAPENGLISRDIEDLTQVPIDENTLPKGWQKARELAGMGKKAKQIILDPNAPNRALNEYNMALYSDAQYGRNKPVADIIDKLGSRQLSNEIDRGAARLLADQLDESGDEFAKNFVTGASEVGGNIGHYKDAPKARLADQRVSELLNIGRSNSMLSDSLAKPTSRNALGDQWKGTINIKGNDLSSGGDDASSVLWHERMHAFQDAEKMGYDKRVVDAYNDLREDLAKLQHDNKQILRDHGGDAKYWGKPIEQEARMAQHYLDSNYGVDNLSKVYARDSKGKIIRVDDNGQELDPSTLHYYTGKPVKRTEYAAEDKQIKAAFDKFIGKLQKLSRQGVALPALAALFGGGAYMASQNNDKEKEVK